MDEEYGIDDIRQIAAEYGHLIEWNKSIDYFSIQAADIAIIEGDINNALRCLIVSRDLKRAENLCRTVGTTDLYDMLSRKEEVVAEDDPEFYMDW